MYKCNLLVYTLRVYRKDFFFETDLVTYANKFEHNFKFIFWKQVIAISFLLQIHEAIDGRW